MSDDMLKMLREWQEAQKAFWTQAMQSPAARAVADFAPVDWPMTGDLLDHLLGRFQSDQADPKPKLWIALLQSGEAYRTLIHATWSEIQRDFEAHRIAVTSGTTTLPDWTELRDRWLAIAEAAFLRLERSTEFVTAQRDLLAAWCCWFAAQDASVRKTIRASREAQRQAQAAAFGIVKTPIAQTSKHEIWRDGRTSVSRYAPLRTDQAVLGPVLICYGLIGRQTMTDLLPQRSLVRNLLAMGVDVFVIDWGSAGTEDAGNDLDHYANGLLSQCIEATRKNAEADRITLMGICQGGTLALCHAASNPDTLNGLICAGTPVDFHADTSDPNPAHGLLNVWIRGLSGDDVDALIDLENALSGDFLGAMFNQLNPVRTLRRYLVDLPAALSDASALNTFMAMETWLADRPDLPAAMARVWLKDLYQDNQLVQGRLSLGGNHVDLGAIRVPVLNITASGDHIIPPPCSTALSAFIPDDRYRDLTIPAGHIGTFVGRQAQTMTAPGIVQWLREKT